MTFNFGHQSSLTYTKRIPSFIKIKYSITMKIEISYEDVCILILKKFDTFLKGKILVQFKGCRNKLDTVV